VHLAEQSGPEARMVEHQQALERLGVALAGAANQHEGGCFVRQGGFVPVKRHRGVKSSPEIVIAPDAIWDKLDSPPNLRSGVQKSSVVRRPRRHYASGRLVGVID